MTSNPSLPSRRHRDVLARARERQARLNPLTSDELLRLEQELFAEEPAVVATLPTPKQLDPLPLLPEPPAEPAADISDFERQHNALRLYIGEQLDAGKKAKEIALQLGLSANKITRWYSEVKNQPAAVRLWTPLITEADLRKWQNQPSASTPEPEPEPEPRPTIVRQPEPSPEALQAAKVALKQAERRVHQQDDREHARQLVEAAKEPTGARRAAAQTLHQEGWTPARIARALELETVTVQRWLYQPVARPLPEGPFSSLTLRSAAFLRPFVQQAKDEAEQGLQLVVANAVEKERVLAALSVLDVPTERPCSQNRQIYIPIMPEEVGYLRHLVELAS